MRIYTQVVLMSNYARAQTFAILLSFAKINTLENITLINVLLMTMYTVSIYRMARNFRRT